MYSLPKDFDLLELKGRTLQMICFAQHSLYLHFDTNLLITIEGSFQHFGARADFAGKQSLPIKSSALLTLIGCQIVESAGEADGTLTLRFTDTESLVIYGDNGPYESYHIKFGEREITV